MLTFDQLRETNVTRCLDAFHYSIEEWSPTDWACALAGECGEACNLIKKLRRLEGQPLTPEIGVKRGELIREVAHELADMIIYADLLAARLGISLTEAVTRKFNIVSERRGSAIRLPEEGDP